MLSPEQKTIGRREFIKAAAALPAVGAYVAVREFTGSRVRCGIIGTGGEGQVLLESAPVNMLDVVCLADINPLHQQQGQAVIEQRWGHKLGKDDIIGDDYRKMLERSDIEAVIIATPLFLHAQMTIDALEAGKHVLCEKTMAYTVDDCRKMRDVAQRTGKTLQIGHQRFYNPLYHKAKQMIDEGLLGDIYHVRALWHRNTDWRRPVDPNWEGAFGDFVRRFGYDSVEHLINWRLYRKYSGGLMTELASHQVAITNWFFGDTRPVAVSASGGLYHYKQDGREIEDHMYVIWEYPDNRTVSYSSILTNRLDHYSEQVMGTKGTLYLTGETDVMFFPEPGAEPPKAEAAAPTEVGVQTAQAGGAVMQASDSRGADAAGSAVGGTGGGGGDIKAAYTEELKGFAHTIRNGGPNYCDAQRGLDAAIACLAANQARDEKRRVSLSEPPLAAA